MERPKTKKELREWVNEHISEFTLNEVEGAFKNYIYNAIVHDEEAVEEFWQEFKKFLYEKKK